MENKNNALDGNFSNATFLKIFGSFLMSDEIPDQFTKYAIVKKTATFDVFQDVAAKSIDVKIFGDFLIQIGDKIETDGEISYQTVHELAIASFGEECDEAGKMLTLLSKMTDEFTKII